MPEKVHRYFKYILLACWMICPPPRSLYRRQCWVANFVFYSLPYVSRERDDSLALCTTTIIYNGHVTAPRSLFFPPWREPWTPLVFMLHHMISYDNKLISSLCMSCTVSVRPVHCKCMVSVRSVFGQCTVRKV